MRAAALPTRSLEHRRDRCFQAFVGITGDQLHALEAACDQAAQERVPERTVFARADVEAEHLALAILIDAHSDHHGHADHAVLLAHFDERGVQLNVRVAAVELAGAEAFHFSIERLAQTADLALGNPAHAERLDQVVDTTGADAVDVGFLDHRDQGTLAAAAGLEQGRVIATVAHARDPQLDAADASVPGALAIPVAFTHAARATLVLVGAHVLRDFELHQFLGHGAHALAQEIDVLVEFGLAQQLDKSHPQILGHRLVPPFGDQDNPDGSRRWPAASTAFVKAHTSGDSTR